MPSSSNTTAQVDARALLQDAPGSWVLDAAGSKVEFHVKHFWGAITVRGHFQRFIGEGTVTPDGAISGRLEIDATSLTTKNRRRDEHLRSDDFFDVERSPQVVVSVDHLTPAGSNTLRGDVTLEAAGRVQTFPATVEIVDATPEAVTLRCELVVDRTAYGMTWSPLGMTSSQARAVVISRFLRR